MKSRKLAENFKSGDIRPILEAMDNEFEKFGLQDNNVVNKVKFASYKIGQWLGVFDRKSDKSYRYTDFYLRMDRDKPTEINWVETLSNPQFAFQMHSLPEKDKSMYAEFLLMEERYIDSPLLWSGIFSSERALEGVKQ